MCYSEQQEMMLIHESWNIEREHEAQKVEKDKNKTLELCLEYDLLKLVEEMEKDVTEILKHLDSPDHIRKYATCLVLDICHLRLIAESK